MSMLLFLLVTCGIPLEMPDARLADARRIMLVFYAGSACDQRLFFFIKKNKTNVVGSLPLDAIAFKVKSAE